MEVKHNIGFVTLLLTMIAGYCDTVTFVSADALFSAHVTGNFIVFAYQFVKGSDIHAWVKLLTFPVFILAVMAGGRIAMREALKLQVHTASFASDIKDAGIDSPTALVAENVVLGAFDAYRTQSYLNSQHLSDTIKLKKLILLAGPSFFTVAGGGIQEAISKLNTK